MPVPAKPTEKPEAPPKPQPAPAEPHRKPGLDPFAPDWPRTRPLPEPKA